MRQGPRYPRSERAERGRPESELLKAAKEIELNGYLHHAVMHDRGGESPKQYHISEHPRTVAARAERLARALGLTEERRAIVRMAIAWHDTVMEFEAADPNDVLSRIRRHRGARASDEPSGPKGNEAQSARLLRGAMEDANRLAGREMFGKEQMELAAWAIDATYSGVSAGPFRDYPFFDRALAQNPALAGLFAFLEQNGITDGPLFSQPHLEQALERGERVPREVLIVALADLDGCGMTSAQEFFTEGDREMRELHANLQEPAVLARIIGGATGRDRSDRSRVREACMEWLKDQAGFAAWQALRFEKIVYLLNVQDGLSESEEQGLRAQFGRFIANARAAVERAAQLEHLWDTSMHIAGERQALADLLKTMGYPVA